MLDVDAERLTTGGQDAQTRNAASQYAKHRSGGADDVLAVVDDDEQQAFFDVTGNKITWLRVLRPGTGQTLGTILGSLTSPYGRLASYGAAVGSAVTVTVVGTLTVTVVGTRTVTVTPGRVTVTVAAGGAGAVAHSVTGGGAGAGCGTRCVTRCVTYLVTVDAGGLTVFTSLTSCVGPGTSSAQILRARARAAAAARQPPNQRDDSQWPRCACLASAWGGGSASAGNGGTAWAGNGTAWAGKGGTASACSGGTAWAGEGGTAWAGNGTAWAGKGGTASACSGGTAWAGKGGTASACSGGPASACSGGSTPSSRLAQWPQKGSLSLSGLYSTNGHQPYRPGRTQPVSSVSRPCRPIS